MTERVDVAVVGAGQAGLATSHELTRVGVEHVVLERGRIGRSWRQRWDSFCLVTPNWTVQLPGRPYDGADPDGYMVKDEIVAYLEGYAASFGAPVREGVHVDALTRDRDGGFLLRTSDGDLLARRVVLSTGAYQRPYRPPAAAGMLGSIPQLDVDGYRNPADLPDGPILIVGSGQTGCQIAEELHQAGRDVSLSCGRAPWARRRVGGRDVVWWLIEGGFFEQGVDTLPSPAARLAANPLATGHDGGHDLHLRTLRALGVTLLGHLVGIDGPRARFAPDLAESVAWGDARYRELVGLIRKVEAERGLPPTEIADPEPFDPSAPEALDLTGFGAVLFTGGFRPDYGSLVPIPGAFDAFGFPIHREGESVAAPGLYFVGVHFLRKRKSSLLYGVGEDAAIVAGAIAAGS